VPIGVETLRRTTVWVEELIDPRDTRKLLVEFARLAEPLRKPGPTGFGMRP
jgi:hypothetical protein